MNSKSKYIEELEKILKSNFTYVKAKGYYGYDPQVYWYLYFTHKAKNNPTFINKVFRKIEIKVIELFPKLLLPYLKKLKIDGVELVPYGLGLFIQAYVNMYQFYKEKKYLEEAKLVADILESKLIKLPNGLGAPNSKKTKYLKFNKGITDNETVYLPSSAEVFEGFYKLFLVTSDVKYLEVLKKIVSSFINDHKIKKLDDKRFVLNYSSVADDTHILNANALAASCMCKLCSIKENQEHLLIVKGINEYLKYYLENYKYLPYAGEEDSKINNNWKTCDTYHMGFTLRGCMSILCTLGEDSSKIVVKVKEMLFDFIDDKGMIKVFINQKDEKQDIHAVAEYVHIFALFYDFFTEEEKQKYLKVCKMNIAIFLKRDKSTYYYKVNKSKKVDLYMPRWAHAPMMNAISLILLKIK